jgi:hypothetical protein
MSLTPAELQQIAQMRRDARLAPTHRLRAYIAVNTSGGFGCKSSGPMRDAAFQVRLDELARRERAAAKKVTT